MFSESSTFYDLLYSWKDYEKESKELIELINEYQPNCHNILDLACGTAEHHKYLKKEFLVDGLDINPVFLEAAQKKNPDGKFFEGDMINFDLGKPYDAILCLFSSIGYVKTFDNLVATLKCCYQHLKTGGLLIVEPWLTPDKWTNGKVHMLTFEANDIKICRMNRSDAKGNISMLDFHYLLGTPDNGVIHFKELHELALFTIDEMTTAFENAGFAVTYDEQGLTGRGIYYGKKSLS